MVKKSDALKNTARRKRSAGRKKLQCPAIIRIRSHKLATFVADQLGLSRSAVSMWKRVPSQHVVAVGALLRIACHRIRPDLYRAK